MKIDINTRPYIREILNPFLNLNLLREGSWLAGGAIRDAINGNYNVSDYDMFFSTPEKAQLVAFSLENNHNFECIFRCPQGELISFKKDKIKIQLVTKFYYRDIEHLIDTFDITACRHATDGKFITTKYSSVRDTLNKKINLHRINFPNSTLKRIQKYIQKGFVLTNPAIEKYVDRIYVAGAKNEFLDPRFYVD
jgi:hypothetical protein